MQVSEEGGMFGIHFLICFISVSLSLAFVCGSFGCVYSVNNRSYKARLMPYWFEPSRDAYGLFEGGIGLVAGACTALGCEGN